jgi:Kef-type K+ transport system membrane component KefB
MLSITDPPSTVSAWRTGLAYVVMLVAAAGLFFVIRAVGEAVPIVSAAPSIPHASPSVVATSNSLLQVLIALAAVVVAGRVLGWLFRRIGQPPVIGEVVAGILLGPSLLGREASSYILPDTVAPVLGIIAQLGVILYMFLVGLELNASRLRRQAHAAVAISHASIVAPFLLGAGLALLLFPDLSRPGVPFTSFALFMGVAMAITAFPVLARILTDQRLAATDLGVLALSCAAVDDLTAWCLLAFVVGVARAEVGGAMLVTALAAGYVAFMFLAVRPLAARFVRHFEGTRPDAGVVAGMLVAVLLSALATEAIGVHAVFGAFLLGAVIPHDSRVARVFPDKLETLVTVLLLPAFFAYTGMRTEIGLVSGAGPWLICGLITLTATVGKVGGTWIAARLTGLDNRTATALGVLMNTRGLMGLIVLSVGLDLGVISPTLFAMMVLMALATTLATAPLLRWFGLGPGTEREGLDDAPHRLQGMGGHLSGARARPASDHPP